MLPERVILTTDRLMAPAMAVGKGVLQLCVRTGLVPKPVQRLTSQVYRRGFGLIEGVVNPVAHAEQLVELHETLEGQEQRTVTTMEVHVEDKDTNRDTAKAVLHSTLSRIASGLEESAPDDPAAEPYVDAAARLDEATPLTTHVARTLPIDKQVVLQSRTGLDLGLNDEKPSF